MALMCFLVQLSITYHACVLLCARATVIAYALVKHAQARKCRLQTVIVTVCCGFCLLHACSPTFTLIPGSGTFYCPASKELRATYTYTSKYVSDVFTGVSAYAFSMTATGEKIISDAIVDCSEYRQGEGPGRCCRRSATALLPAEAVMFCIKLNSNSLGCWDAFRLCQQEHMLF